MFFRKKDERATMARPTPRWFKVIVIAFLAYALVHHAATRREKAAEEGNPQPSMTEALKEVATFPIQLEGVQMRESNGGTGPESYCGQQVTLRYGLSLKDRPLVENETVKVTLGSADLLPGMTEIVEGMKKGSLRSFFLGPRRAFDAPNHARGDVPAGSIVRGEVELLEAAPLLPESPMPLRVTVPKEGSGPGLKCGEQGVFRLDVWNMKGERVHASARAPLYWRLGVSGLPLGLERALSGMPVGEVRTVILPPAYLKPVSRFEKEFESGEKEADGKAEKTQPPLTPPGDIAWPKQGLVVVDVQRME